MTSPIPLTPEQLRLARHALGLPNDRSQSYRNRYCAGVPSSARNHWLALEAAGLAFSDAVEGQRQFFALTRTGAEMALERGETLDLEDFPHD